MKTSHGFINVPRKCVEYVVKESLERFLKEKYGITEEKIREAYKDYRFIPNVPNFKNPLTIEMSKYQLFEGLVRTYPIDKTISYIKDYFRLEDWQISKQVGENGIEKIFLNISTAEGNFELVKRAMGLCGYFLAWPKEEDVPLNTFAQLLFEPRIQQNVFDRIRREERTLYHLTLDYNIDKIMHIGLSPRCRNKLFNFPNRIYLFRGSCDKNTIYNVGKQLNHYNNSLGNNGRYILIKLDLNRIPNNVPFYYDVNFKYGVFTNSNIDKNAIIDLEYTVY